MTDRLDTTSELRAVPTLSGSDEVAIQLLRARALDAPPRPGLLAALDRFEVVELVGQGGMGLVLLARDPVGDVKVAIKILRPELTRDAQAVKRFLTEARHMHRLDHERIVRVLEVCDRPTAPYYVMPYHEQGSLARLIKPSEPCEPNLALRIACDVAEALAHAHSQGIIHRDVKPLNVLLDVTDRACLTDFGLVRAFDHNESLLELGREGRIGTVAYMSPAVARGEAEDTRCDIYSFGALLYEMLTGEPPYSGESREAIFAQILAGPPVPVRTRNPRASSGLVAIVEGCMARELRDRYASMSDVLADLKRIDAGQTPVGPHGQQLTVRNARVRTLGMAVLLVLAAWGVWEFGLQGDSHANRKDVQATTSADSRSALGPGNVSPPVSEAKDSATGSELRCLTAGWPVIFDDDLKSAACLKRLELSYPLTGMTRSPTFRVLPGEGLQIGWGSYNVAWINCLIGDQYALSVDFQPFLSADRPDEKGTGLWLNGPGYGISPSLGFRFWIAADGQQYALFRRGAPVAGAGGQLDRPLNPNTWHRLDFLRQGDHFAAWLDGKSLFDLSCPSRIDDGMSSYIGIGSASAWHNGPQWAKERANDPVFRSLSIRMPATEVRRLAPMPLERRWDGLSEPLPRPNGDPLFVHEFTQAGLAGWIAPADPDCARASADGLVLAEWGRSPLVWREAPLRGDCAVEFEVRFLPEVSPHCLYLCLATDDPGAASDFNYTGWYVAVPHAGHENFIFWCSADAHASGRIWCDFHRPRTLVSLQPYFCPVPGRQSVFRLERTGKHLRVFSNRHFVMEGDSPEAVAAGANLYVGVGKTFSPKVIRSVRAWALRVEREFPSADQ